jgi:hypothetical protein
MSIRPTSRLARFGLLPALLGALPLALLLSGAPIAAEPAVEIAPPAVVDPGGSFTSRVFLSVFWLC